MLTQEKIQPSGTTVEAFLQNWRPQRIETASSFPAQMYTSEYVYQLEQERVFGKRWLYVGDISQLPEPGSYFTLEIAQQPLLIVKNLDGQLRGFFNVCPHRAGPIALDAGQCHRFTCLYHAWTFDLNGELKAMPHMADAEALNPGEFGLKPIQVDTWGPFIFINLDPHAEPLTEQLSHLIEHFDRFNFSKLAKVKRIDYEANANWKLYVENSSESYHVAMVHPSLDLFKALDRFEADVQQHYYTEYFPFLENSDELQKGFAPGLYIDGLNEWEMQGTSVTVLYPNLILVTSPNFVLARMVNPQGLSKTHVRFEWFVPNTDVAKSDANVAAVVQIYDQVVREDLVMLDHVQQRVRSLSYTPGRLSPELEVGVHRFQHALMEYIR
ncbi:MAG: aromatic ring-hydroxylating dioxygenase subunit alpha [Oculatellaceae cyanobacterium bins.114]|nr:aromatic ring-hydroxylating dioxygenase subunit alpha [Oculatellaceae cyanobacterium bins.114]